jgi:LuxR family transcriptional regulator, maltose regulon positive regulatory protein
MPRSSVGQSSHPGHQPLIVTKTTVPHSVTEIERPRLLGKLKAATTCKLILIDAPAGFGKTAIGAAWCAELRRGGYGAAWFTIDAEDDEPNRFITYLIHTATQVVPDEHVMLEVVSGAALTTTETAIAVLINALTEADGDIFLFLDDYDNIRNPEIHNAVTRLLQHAPSEFHLVLMARNRPLLPLATLQANGEMFEIDAAALRFDLDETDRFVGELLRRPARAEEVRQLQTATDGWAVGLRVLAVAARRSVAGSQPVLSEPSAALSAYLAEMLASLSDELVDFMLKTSILERLTTSLCEAVTGMPESGRLLQAISEQYLLATRIDEEGHWFRYHHLLSEYLRKRMTTHPLQEVQGLHRRAAWWYAARSYWQEAVNHAFAANELDEARLWIAKCATGLVRRGDLLPLLAWHHSLSNALIGEQTHIALAIARALALAMRFDEAEALLNRIDTVECEPVQAMLAGLRDNSKLGCTLARACLARGVRDGWTRDALWNVVRFGEMNTGDLTAFYATPAIVSKSPLEAENALTLIYRHVLCGLVAFRCLQPEAAEEHFRDAVALGERHVGVGSGTAALPSGPLALVLYEANRVGEAEDLLLANLMGVRAMGLHETVLTTYVVLARIAVIRSNFERARLLLEKGEELGELREWPRVRAAMLLERIRLAGMISEISEASACRMRLQAIADSNSLSVPCSRSDIHRFAVLGNAYYQLSVGTPGSAIDALIMLSDEAVRLHRYDLALRANILLAASMARVGDPAHAETVLLRASQQAKKGRMLRTLIDDAGLLAPILTSGSRALNAVRAITGTVTQGWGTSAPTVDSGHIIPNPLAPRELDILQLVADGLSNKEIAQALRIAPETVKTHVKNVFTKLAVQRRIQAVLRAQSLGLLRTT